MRRTSYRVAGESLVVEVGDAWSAGAIDALFSGWYLTPEAEDAAQAAPPAIAVHSEAGRPPIPAGCPAFDVAGGGTCYTDGRASYIEIGGSVVAIGTPDRADVEVWLDGPLPLESPALTRLVTYALSAALRQRQRFELHSGALVEPATGTGVLLVGPSGSGKSTLSVHLATAGWPFLTDDVLLLSREPAGVTAWPLRRCFAITPQTFAASAYLQARTSIDAAVPQSDKQPFLPDHVFAGEFRDRCVPATVIFPELTGAESSVVSRLSAADTMARLIRMNPWACYDRSTAAAHLGVLSALATQVAGWSLGAGRDLLEPEAAVRTIAACCVGGPSA